MPITYHIAPEHDLIVYTHVSPVTRREALDLIDRLEADPQFHSLLDEVHDFTHGGRIDIDSEDIRELFKLMLGILARAPEAASGALGGPSKRNLFVVDKGDGARVVEIFSDLMSTRDCTRTSVHTTLPEALTALGLPPKEELALDALAAEAGEA